MKRKSKLISVAFVVATSVVAAATVNAGLGNYPDTSIPLSTDTTVTPDAPPTDTISMNVSTSTSFDGTLEADPVTGVVRVTDAHSAGTYTVTVTAFDSGGVNSIKTFTLTVTTPMTCTPIAFTTVTRSFGFNGGNQVLVVGDFNGDGKQDLGSFNSYISILLGDGTGSFGAVTNLSTGGGYGAGAVGDFNGDGKPDLAVTNYDLDIVSIFLGDGAGNFSAPTNFSVGASPYTVVVGDFNSDGRQDLAVSNEQSNAVSILLGDGAGNFSGASFFGVGSSPESVRVGDFNSDGKQDLAVANYDTNNVSILLGDGAGNFSTATNFGVGAEPFDLAVGDFNGDGKEDLAVANYNSDNMSTVSVLLGDGTGNFSAATNLPATYGPVSIVTGDFNGDGNQDLAVANDSIDNGLSIFVGDGTGSFSAITNFPAGGNSGSVVVGDFNGDGKQDLAVDNYLSNKFSILLRDCPTMVQVTVRTSPSGRTFSVDGTTYSSTQTFSWTSASNHTIATTSPQSGGTGVQYVWSKWSDRGAISHTVAPTSNATYTATFKTQYLLTMTHNAGGKVSPKSGWKNSGAAVSIGATPNSGYSFSTWTGSGSGSYSGTNNPASVTMGGPITEAASFTHN